jgi:hypothetical protein
MSETTGQSGIEIQVSSTPPPPTLTNDGEKGLTAIERASVAIGLSSSFIPKTNVQGALKKAKVKPSDAIDALRNSSREEAIAIITKFDLLSPSERKAVTIDHLIAATGIDVYSAMGAIVEATTREGANVSMLIAAVAHPQVMEKTVKFAMRADGFADRQLLHRSMSTTPVPKSTVNNVTMRDIRNTNVQLNGNVPTLADVGRVVDQVVGGDDRG